MKKITLSIVSMALLANVAVAGNMDVEAKSEPVKVQESVLNGVYAGVGIGLSNVKSYYYKNSSSPTFSFKLGYEINRYLDVETIFTKGVKKSNKLYHDYSYGLFVKPKYSFDAKNITLYALAGYSKNKIKFDNEANINNITNNTTTKSSFSYGAGVSYKINKKYSVYVEAIRWIDKTYKKGSSNYAIKIKSINIGAKISF